MNRRRRTDAIRFRVRVFCCSPAHCHDRMLFDSLTKRSVTESFLKAVNKALGASGRVYKLTNYNGY